MLLYIVRHAWAGEFGDPDYPDDAARPLTDEGRKRFSQMARLLSQREVAPGLIATSPLVRARQTAELLAKHLPGDAPLVVRDELAPQSNLKGLLAWSAAQDVDAQAWVGHAPDVSDLTADLIGGRANLRFAKGAVAAIRFPAEAALGAGQLLWLVTAKILGV